MPVIPGDIEEISFNHPDVGSGVIYPKSQEEGTYDPGGIRTADDNANVDGGGRSINPKQRTRWFVQVPITHDMNEKQELQKLEQIARSPREATFTTQHISGDVRKGTGTVVGDIQANVGAGTIDFKISGGGRLEKIA